MEKHTGGLADYKAAEGKCVEVPYKGSVQSTIQDILGGL
jgi:GMP reductase